MRNNQFCFRDFSGKLITSKNMPFVDGTGTMITPSLGTSFIDGRGYKRRVGESFFDFSAESRLIEPR